MPNSTRAHASGSSNDSPFNLTSYVELDLLLSPAYPYQAEMASSSRHHLHPARAQATMRELQSSHAHTGLSANVEADQYYSEHHQGNLYGASTEYPANGPFEFNGWPTSYEMATENSYLAGFEDHGALGEYPVLGGYTESYDIPDVLSDSAAVNNSRWTPEVHTSPSIIPRSDFDEGYLFTYKAMKPTVVDDHINPNPFSIEQNYNETPELGNLIDDSGNGIIFDPEADYQQFRQLSQPTDDPLMFGANDVLCTPLIEDSQSLSPARWPSVTVTDTEGAAGSNSQGTGHQNRASRKGIPLHCDYSSRNYTNAVRADPATSEEANWPDAFDTTREAPRNLFLLFPHQASPARKKRWTSTGKWMVPGVPGVIQKQRCSEEEFTKAKENAIERKFGMRLLLYRLLGAGNNELNVEGQRLLNKRGADASGTRTDVDRQARNFGNSISRVRDENHLGFTDIFFKRVPAQTKDDVTKKARDYLTSLFFDDDNNYNQELGEARLLHNTRWNIDHEAMTFYPPREVREKALPKTGMSIPAMGYPLQAPVEYPKDHNVRKVWALLFPDMPFPDIDRYLALHPQYLHYNPRQHWLWNVDRDALPGDPDWTPVPRDRMPLHGYVYGPSASSSTSNPPSAPVPSTGAMNPSPYNPFLAHGASNSCSPVQTGSDFPHRRFGGGMSGIRTEKTQKRDEKLKTVGRQSRVPEYSSAFSVLPLASYTPPGTPTARLVELGSPIPAPSFMLPPEASFSLLNERIVLGSDGQAYAHPSTWFPAPLEAPSQAPMVNSAFRGAMTSEHDDVTNSGIQQPCGVKRRHDIEDEYEDGGSDEPATKKARNETDTNLDFAVVQYNTGQEDDNNSLGLVNDYPAVQDNNWTEWAQTTDGRGSWFTEGCNVGNSVEGSGDLGNFPNNLPDFELSTGQNDQSWKDFLNDVAFEED